MPMSAAARRNVPGISSGSVANSSSGRTSITTGPDGMPTRRTSLSDEIVFKTGMMRPFTKQDAILQPVASWGDRVPHATIMPCPSVLVNVRSCRPERGLPVRERAGRTQGDRAHLRISAYIGVCHCGQAAVSKLLYAIWTRELPMLLAKVAGKHRFKVWDAPLRIVHRVL